MADHFTDMNIFLTGFMGSGKSTFGRKLAKQLGLRFYDLDKMVEEKAKCSVEDIFKYLGEDTFRQMESECLHTFEGQENFVLSCGGGTPCYFDNMEFIMEQGLCIYLEMDEASLFNRLVHAKSVRPTIKGFTEEELKLFIKDTLAKRREIYERAHLVVPALSLKPAELKELVESYREA